MTYHIIAILGKAGKDREGNLVKSTYSKDSYLKVSGLKNGDFYNSTHCLIESFGESSTYTFLGTSDSIEFQNDIFANHPQCKAIFETNKPIVLGDNELESVFHQILESIKSAKENNIILDITHGFRHQPIIASFASTLGQINTQKSITLLFAKELKPREEYQYISLEKYSQISLITLSLQTFVQTLSVPNIVDKKEYPFIDILTRFSNALHANAFAQIFGQLNNAKNELQKIKNNVRFGGLEKILDEVERILEAFETIKNIKEQYKQYYEISRFMNEKGYYLIAITYIKEAIPLYVSDKLKDFTKRNVRPYDKSKAIEEMIKGNPLDRTVFDDVDYLDKKLKKQNFDGLKMMIENISKIRNDLAHINPKPKELTEIKNSLNATLEDFKNKCLIQDCLKNL